jgi:methionyl-tRNA formyltransferase
LRVVFLGNAAWSVPPLEALAGSSHEIAAVVTRAPRPAGRGNKLTPTPVAEATRAMDLPVEEVETVKRGAGFEALRGAAPDVMVVVAYGEILPQAVLDLPRVAPVNLHFSLLPELRGAAPVQRAILEDLSVTGVTTIRMDAGMDTGPVYLRAEERIEPDDDAGSLGTRLGSIGGRLLVDTLDRLSAGAIEPQPQDEAKATYAPKLGREDEIVDWSEPRGKVVLRVRALSPQPAARTLFRGKVLKVYRVSDEPHPMTSWRDSPPGEIVFVGSDVLAVAAGGGVVILEEIAPEGRRRMSGADFVRGYRPEPGERLG